MNRETKELMKSMLTIMDDPKFNWTPFAHMIYDRIEDYLNRECREEDINYREEDIISGGECV